MLSFAQTSPKNMTSQEINQKVDLQLKEVFGEYYSMYIEGKPDQLEFYSNFYKRCEYLSIDNAPEGIDNISILELLEKYNPNVIVHDNISVFDETKFNILKYRFDYYNNTDRYFRIYNTNVVLKINKL